MCGDTESERSSIKREEVELREEKKWIQGEILPGMTFTAEEHIPHLLLPIPRALCTQDVWTTLTLTITLEGEHEEEGGGRREEGGGRRKERTIPLSISGKQGFSTGLPSHTCSMKRHWSRHGLTHQG